MIDRIEQRREVLQRMVDAANELTGLLLAELADARLDMSRHVMNRLADGAELEMSLNLQRHECELVMHDTLMGCVPLARSVIPEDATTLQ